MARYDQVFSLFILDIDDFQDINQVQGRVHGDQILQAVARVLVGDTRETDLVARYNDEQFIVVMPHTDLEGRRSSRKKSAAGSNERSMSRSPAAWPRLAAVMMQRRC